MSCLQNDTFLKVLRAVETDSAELQVGLSTLKKRLDAIQADSEFIQLAATMGPLVTPAKESPCLSMLPWPFSFHVQSQSAY
jgi:hypothetical protein